MTEQTPTSPGQSAGPERVSVRTYTSYIDAQRAVDHLSDQRFPVQSVRIVGSDLKRVEQVLGRLNWGRAALSGIAGGAWLGLLPAFLLWALVPGIGFGKALLLGLLYGALFGLILGLVSYAMTGGKRDFISRSELQPAHYDIQVESAHADQARQLLTGH